MPNRSLNHPERQSVNMLAAYTVVALEGDDLAGLFNTNPQLVQMAKPFGSARCSSS